VEAYFCGHDHRGGYVQSSGGVHHITVAGMVQAPLHSNAYAVLKVFPELDTLVVDGLDTMVVSHATLQLRRPLSKAPRQNKLGAAASTNPLGISRDSKL
jgi:hypothetical protein